MGAVTSSPDGLRLINEPRRLLRGSRQDASEIWAHRQLLRAFVARELRSRYKGATLGWLWALVRPLVMLFVYGVAVGIFLGAGRAIPQFMIFIYSGLLAWTLFTAIVQGCISAVVANGQLLTRSNFPAMLIPLSVTGAALIDFLLQASVLTVAYLIVGDWPLLQDAFFLVPALFTLILTALGFGALLSALNVYARDIGFLVDVGLQVAFWLTPILYAYGHVVRAAYEFHLPTTWVTQVYMLNPMANVVVAFQRALWPAARTPEASAFSFPGDLEIRLAIFSVAALVMAWLGLRLFVKMSANFGQEL